MSNMFNDEADDDLPDPPEELPSYVEDTITNWTDDAEVLAAISAFADDLRAAAEGEPTLAETDGEVVAVNAVQGTLVSKLQQCGDDSCKCTSGDEANLHGPYLWDVHRDEDGERVWEYVGKATDADEPTA